MKVHWSVALSALALLLTDSAHAEWRPARVLAPHAVPRAAIATPGGGLALLAGERTAARFSWTDPVAPAQISALPAAPRVAGDQRAPWAGNARGDVVLVAHDTRVVRALAVDASGARAAMSERVIAGHETEDVAVAIGADGTAVVAWTAMRDREVSYASRVWVSVHRPGIAAWSTAAVVTAGGTHEVAVGVAADGTVELAFSAATDAYHAEWAPGAAIGRPVRIAGSEFGFGEVRLLAGGPGRSRVVLTEGDVIDVKLHSVVRAADGGWLPPQLLDDEDIWTLGEIVAGFAERGAVIAYQRADDVVARWAAPGAAFGASQRIGRVQRGWSPYTFEVASGPRGDVLIAWIEASDESRFRFAEVCGTSCHERVVAAVVGPDRSVAPARRISPLGARTSEDLVVALSESGERLVAWQAGETGAQPAGSLVAVTGDAQPDGVAAPDTRSPRVTVELGAAALRTAAKRGRLRARVRCNEACAVRVTVLSSDDDDMLDLDTLAPVVRDRAGIRAVTWRLTRAQSRGLRRILAVGSVYVTVRATDAAGNLRALNLRRG